MVHLQCLSVITLKPVRGYGKCEEIFINNMEIINVRNSKEWDWGFNKSPADRSCHWGRVNIWLGVDTDWRWINDHLPVSVQTVRSETLQGRMVGEP